MTSARFGETELASSVVASAMWEITDDIEIENEIDPSAIPVEISFGPICKSNLQN